MVKLRPEDKAEMAYTEWIGEGVYKVKIKDIQMETNANGKEYIEVSVVDDDGATGSHRMYLSEAAVVYTLNDIRSIYIHNTPEARRDEVRKKFDKLDDTDELATLFLDMMGKECWFSRFPDGTTYQNDKGQTRNRYNTRIAGYELQPPKKTQSQMVDDLIGSSSPAGDDPEIPFGN